MSDRIINIKQLMENQAKTPIKRDINKLGTNIEYLDKDYKIESEVEKEELDKRLKQNPMIDLKFLDRHNRIKLNLLNQFV
jgi:hypothetical protein